MTGAVLVMELAVASLLLGWAWVAVAASPWPAPWPILLIAPLALVVGRKVPSAWKRSNWFDTGWWAAVALVVAVLAELGNSLAAGEASLSRWNVQFFAGLILAWRGLGLSDGWVDRELIESEFQIGTVVVLAILVALVWVSPGAGLLPAVMFAAAGLVGLGLARRAERRDPRAGPESDWIVLLGGLVVAIVLVAVLVVLLVTPEVLLSIWEQAYSVAEASVAGIGALFTWIFSFFPTFGGQPDQIQTGGSRSGGVGPIASPTPPASAVTAPPFWVLELFLTLIGVIFLFFAVRAIMKLMRMNVRSVTLRMPRQRETPPPLSSGDAFTWAGWWRSFMAWFRAWVRGGRGTTTGRTEQDRQNAQPAEAEQRSIRALYRELLAAAARAGFERLPSTTPNELARDVTSARPSARPSVSAATDLYVRARYGEEHVSRDELARMRSAVQQARKEMTTPPKNTDT